MKNIMVNENGHDIKLVREINNLWKRRKTKFGPIFHALSVRDEAKIKEKSLDKHGVFNPEYGKLEDFANCYLNEVADDDTLLIIISYVGNWGSRKDVLMEKILNLPCHRFTNFMRSIGIFGKDDEVLDYSPSDLVCVIDDANRAGYDVDVDLPCGHDYFLYIKYSGENPNGTCAIRGLLDDSEDWINTFNLNEIVEKYEAEIEKFY